MHEYSVWKNECNLFPFYKLGLDGELKTWKFQFCEQIGALVANLVFYGDMLSNLVLHRDSGTGLIY